jgi:anti-sigma factor RsiW
MSECTFEPYLSAYHDRELDADLREQVERHLAACPACSAQLREIEELSLCIARADLADVGEHELTHMHEAVDAIGAEQIYGRQLLRTAGFFGALAASVLIISAVWLRELPSGNAGPAMSERATLALPPEWERVAINLRADPRPGLADDSPFSPRYAAAVDWMLKSLAQTERKPWVKPNSL